MNEPTSSSRFLVDHQRLIALMQSAKPPPDDGSTPPIPDELLRRLRDLYGQAPVQLSVVRTVEHSEDVADQPPPTRRDSFWRRMSTQLRSPQLALAAVIVLLGLVVSIMLPHEDADRVRGGTASSSSLPVYWLASDSGMPAPSGLGLPKFISIRTDSELPKTGTVLVFDPVHREARTIKNGSPVSAIGITDAQDIDECLAAHQQLLKQLQP